MPDKRRIARRVRRETIGALPLFRLWPLLLMALLLSGCGSHIEADETAAQADPPLLDLPALVLAYDTSGTPTVGGLPLSDLDTLLPVTLTSRLTLDAATVQQITDAGIQHIVVSSTPTGLHILVNGQPLPALVWDEESLDNLRALLSEADQPSIGTLGDLAGTAQNLSVGLVVQFPLSAGTAPLPLIAAAEQSNAVRARAERQAFLEGAGSAPAIRIPVQYTADGTWSVGGVTDTEWQALTGLPFGYLRLNPQLLRDAAAAGIRQVIIWTDADGLHVTIGDRRLPYLRSADGGLYTLIDLLLRLHIISGAEGGEGNEDAPAAPPIQWLPAQWLPVLQATELRIVVNFPP